MLTGSTHTKISYLRMAQVANFGFTAFYEVRKALLGLHLTAHHPYHQL
jgi:hypothetical protein